MEIQKESGGHEKYGRDGPGKIAVRADVGNSFFHRMPRILAFTEQLLQIELTMDRQPDRPKRRGPFDRLDSAEEPCSSLASIENAFFRVPPVLQAPIRSLSAVYLVFGR